MIGAVVRCYQTKNDLWVVRQHGPDGRLHLRGKRRYGRGWTRYTARVAGAGDVSVLAEPPTYPPGTELTHDGLPLVVIEDRGDTVVCSTSDMRTYFRDGTTLRVPGGNTIELSKADIVLEELP